VFYVISSKFKIYLFDIYYSQSESFAMFFNYLTITVFPIKKIAKKISILSLFGLTACATAPSESNNAADPKQEQLSTTAKSNPQNPNFDQKIGTALVSPFSDLNIVRTNIPVILVSAKKAPYAINESDTCESHLNELEALNAVLGTDLDEVKYDEKGNLIEQGGVALGDAVVGALRGVTEGVIPFRSWVRKITGADRYAKDVAAASMAGLVRRAFLKGVVKTKSCSLPSLEKKN
jgi:hypothetical protein